MNMSYFGCDVRQRTLRFYRHLTQRIHAPGCFSAFAKDESGNIIIMAGVALPVAIAAVGAAVTLSEGNATRASMQAALDAAVLAGLGESNIGDPVSTAQIVFQNNVGQFAK